MVTLIGGETVADLVEALQELEVYPEDGGMAQMGGPVGPPAVRALMRLEADLLLADADALASMSGSGRTAGQRRHDAFHQLVKQLAERVASPPE
ncbi:hypothetical protein [uncultured Jatrophihabitans sp.]|uniref:hypothetical protein n=1 Tax=uncultured Jatrophihabitans sp. TaxID=1610747 RepID=UPI0035C9B810